jgi:beta-galactosidase beta subunit
MGWAPRAQLQQQDAPFDTEHDSVQYQDDYAADFCVNPGELVVFFPEDGHAPLLGEGAVHKAVFKVRVD